MKKSMLENKVQKIIKKKFKIKKKIKNISMDNTEKWDSLAHLILVTEIEKIFKIKFKNIEISKITDAKKIISAIQKKLKS